MLTANELRVNNIVKETTHGRVCKIKDIGTLGVNRHPDFVEKSVGFCHFEELDGIPLTPKVLEKVGAKKRYASSLGDVYELLLDNRVDIRFGKTPPNKIDIKFMGNTIRSIEYVHELQNLFYAISKQELIYKP